MFIDKIVENDWFKTLSYPILTINQSCWLIENEELLMYNFLTFDYNQNKCIDSVISMFKGQKPGISIEENISFMNRFLRLIKYLK